MKKILFSILLIAPFIGFAQELEYRIAIKKKGTLKTTEYEYSDGYLNYKDANGKNHSVKSKNIIAVRSIIKDWDYFEWNESDFTDFVVVNVDDLKQNELFNIAVNWIKETYKNPDEVIKTTIDESKIRFEGYSENGIKYQGITMVPLGAKYTIELSFKDGKYKFNPIALSYRLSHPIGEVDVSVSSTKQYYDSSGDMVYGSKYFPRSVEALFDNLNMNLYNYIIQDKTNTSLDDDW